MGEHPRRNYDILARVLDDDPARRASSAIGSLVLGTVVAVLRVSPVRVLRSLGAATSTSCATPR